MRNLIIFATAISAAACGDGPPPGLGPMASMLIANHSQYELVDLRIHSSETFLNEASLIERPIAENEEVAFYGSGDVWVTVVRERYRMGPLVALTTAEPITMARDNTYHVWVFDDSFRLDTEHPRIEPENLTGPIFGHPDG